MALSSRERNISVAVIGLVSLLLLDWAVLDPYLEWRSDLSNQAHSRAIALATARHTLDREIQLRQLLAGMSGSIKSDPSAAEGQILHLVHDWEQQAGIKNPSFERVRVAEQPGFSQMTFHLSGIGSVTAVATLLYRVETSAIPVRIDDIQISSKHDNGDELLLHLTLSTLCHRAPTVVPARSVEVAGGWQ